MLSNENSYFNSLLSQATRQAPDQALSQTSTQLSADSPQVQFMAMRSGESAAQPEVRQITEQQDLEVNPVRPSDSLSSHLVWLLPLWGAIVWLLLFCTASEAWKLVRHNVTTAKQGQRVPCKNCRYFSNNFYLKCSVRPSDALTERAVDCSDFCQKSPTEEAKPQTKRSLRR